MLTRASLLLYWRAADLVPQVGGDLAYTRNGAGRYVDRAGNLRRAIVDGTREQWATRPGGRAPGLLLERAAENLVTYSEDLSQWTDTGTITLTPSVADPAGGTDAYTVDAGSAGASIALTVSVDNDGDHALSIYLRQRTAAATYVGLLANGNTWRHRLRIEWQNGVPIPRTIVGSGEVYAVEQLVDGWWRVSMSVQGVEDSDTNAVHVHPAAGSTGSLDVYGVQLEEGPWPSSYIATDAATATRAVDKCHITRAPGPQAMCIYARWWTHISSAAAGGERVWQLGGTTAPYLVHYTNGGAIRAQMHNGTAAADASATLAYSPGELLESAVTLRADGSVHLAVARGGGLEYVEASAAAPSGGLAADWTRQLHLNGADTLAVGAGMYSDVWAVRAADMVHVPGTAAPHLVMAELRELQRLSAGGVL